MVQLLLQRSTRGLLLLVRLVIDVELLPLARCHFLPDLPEDGTGGRRSGPPPVGRAGKRPPRPPILDTGPRFLVVELVGLVISLASGERVVPDALRLLQTGRV